MLALPLNDPNLFLEMTQTSLEMTQISFNDPNLPFVGPGLLQRLKPSCVLTKEVSDHSRLRNLDHPAGRLALGSSAVPVGAQVSMLQASSISQPFAQSDVPLDAASQSPTEGTGEEWPRALGGDSFAAFWCPSLVPDVLLACQSR